MKYLAELLKVLANEHRLQILCELMESPKTVSVLGEKISNITQSGLSQHLGLLKAHGIVSDQRAGQNVTYRIADTRVESVIATLKLTYCQPKTHLAD